MTKGRQILSPESFSVTIHRLASQIIENYGVEKEINIVGIQEKGVVLAERLIKIINKLAPDQRINLGKLDITFYRDDFRMRQTPLKANATQINFDIESKNILLIDDVLYTGRTIHAAVSALQDFGRISKLELLTMVDRQFNRHLPIKSDYTGLQVDSLDAAYVKVLWEHLDGKDEIRIFSAKSTKTND